MPFAQGVDEARHYIQEAMNNEKKTSNNVGDELDPALEQDNLECQDDEQLIHPDFVTLNPDDLEYDDDLAQIRKTLKTSKLKHLTRC